MSDQAHKLSGNISKVLAIMVLRNDGSRIYSKYYTKLFSPALLRTPEGSLDKIENQKAFEKTMVDKSKKLTSTKAMNQNQTEIFSLGQFNIVFKVLNDILIYVVGDYEENQVLLSYVLQSLQESLNYFTKEQISKNTIVEQYENLIILIDEMIDEGIIVTLEVDTLIARCSMKDCDKIQTEKQSESSFSSAKNSITKTWNL